jgi:hypothetical protein
MFGREKRPTEEPFSGGNDLYEVARASALRIYVFNVIHLTIGAAVAAGVTAWYGDEPGFLALAPVFGLLGAVFPALRHRNAALENVEGTLWGPSANGSIPGDPHDRVRIRLEEVDRNARNTWGLLAPLLGWRRIRAHDGREIRYCRLWYDPTDLDTFLMRLGLS